MIFETIRTQLNSLPIEARFKAIAETVTGLTHVMLDMSAMAEGDCRELMERHNLMALERYMGTKSNPKGVVPLHEVLRAAYEIGAMMVLCQDGVEEISTAGMYG